MTPPIIETESLSKRHGRQHWQLLAAWLVVLAARAILVAFPFEAWVPAYGDAFALAVVALAALTRDLAGFALAGLGTVVGFGVSLALLAILFGGPHGGSAASLYAPVVLFVAASSLVVLATRYLRRSRPLAIALTAAFTAGLAVLFLLWPGEPVVPGAQRSGPEQRGEPLRLRSGAATTAGGHRFTILSAACDDRICRVAVRDAAARLFPGTRTNARVAFLLVNRKLGVTLLVPVIGGDNGAGGSR